MNSHRLKQLKLHLKQLQNDIAAKKNIKEILLVADVLDINHFGIKVKLSEPLQANLDNKIKFQLTLPQSGSILTLSGFLNDSQTNTHHSVSLKNRISIDEAVYDCLKLSDTTLLIKTV